MEFIIQTICSSLVLWIGLVAGEIVLLHTPEPTSSRCSFPTQLEFKVLRHKHDYVRLQLNTNEILKMPSHVVLMSLDETSTGISYQRVEIPQTSKAYHSVQGGASFVVHCFLNTQTTRYYYAIEGTFFHEETKFKLRSTVNDVGKSQSDAALTYVMDEVTEFNNPEDHEYIDKLEAQRAESTPTRNTAREFAQHRREKRSTTDYFIDILPIIDFNLYHSWSSQNSNDVGQTATAINTYITNVFTSMALRIGSLNLRNEVVLNLRMVTPHLSTSASTSPYSENNKDVLSDQTTKINVVTLLDEFRDWLDNTTTNDNSTLPQHDHAMLFTGFDVYGGNDGEIGSNLTKGLAYIGTICQTDGHSSSVVQDLRAYQSEPVAVHELGHGLGSKHDGDGNNCESLDRFIMSNGSYTRDDNNTFNPFRFSTCSSSAISSKIEELESESNYLNNCLVKSIGTNNKDIVPLDATDQCRSLFGPTSYICRGSKIPPLEDMCTSLYCSIPGTGMCRELIAATGSCCGNGKYCKEGHCVAAGSGECVMDETCPLGDQPGAIIQDKTCEEIHSAYCYQQNVNDLCCKTCQKHKTDIEGCSFGDKQPGCIVGDCAKSCPNGLKYDFMCCQTCSSKTYICQNTATLSFQGQTYSCQGLITEHGKDLCYFQAVHDKFCCGTCEEERLPDTSCPYGDKKNLFNCYKLFNLNRYCTEEEKEYCCETCPKLTVVTEPPATGNPASGSSTGRSNIGGDDGAGDTTTSCEGICGRGGTAHVSVALFGVVCVFKYLMVSLMAG